jgi:hypothetical protein
MRNIGKVFEGERDAISARIDDRLRSAASVPDTALDA